jgi:hypothetical protein
MTIAILTLWVVAPGPVISTSRYHRAALEGVSFVRAEACGVALIGASACAEDPRSSAVAVAHANMR